MKQQLVFLRESAPVLLDPVLRTGKQRAGLAVPWHLPQLPRSRTLLTFGGTAALYQAARVLQLKQHDRILVPAYNCGHEVEPLLRAGAQVGFYRIDDRLQIDLEHLTASVDGSTRAVLVTHYFGFPQPLRAIRELCDQRGITLIEDCAHALLSCDGQVPLGLSGHMAVFSLRKTLPLPHGGALISHEAELFPDQGLQAPPALSVAPKILERYQKGWLLPESGTPGSWRRAAFVGTRLLVDAARGMRALLHATGTTQLDPDDESLDFPTQALNWGMSASVAGKLPQTDAAAIVATRRRNFETLLGQADRFANCHPLLTKLPDGVCPLYFPLRSREPERVARHLQRHAIASVQWWTTQHPAVPWDQFPEALRLKQQLIALPVHQDLGDAHMQRMAQLLMAP